MFKLICTLTLFSFSTVLFAQKPPLLHLQYNQNYTPTYSETIGMYRLLDKNYKNAVLLEKGTTDCGKPLHLFVINSKPVFNPEKIRKEGKAILLINNGIHPGEPEGIDACLEFADDILRNKNGMDSLLKNMVIIIIPVYNIGGHLNRSAYNRSGQTTPYETGFRGNYANYDLNRDFTKCDTKNALGFTEIFQEWQPDVFLDTHTTNGSDHQYSITLVPPSPKLFPRIMGDYISTKFVPELYSEMKKGKYVLIPYVDYFYNDPRQGIASSQSGPRYSSGYASMFHTLGMMTENEIYHNYPDRVKSCYQFIETLARNTHNNSSEIIGLRKKGIAESLGMTKFPVAYQIDTTRYKKIEFKGYTLDMNQLSNVTGLKRMGYDRSKPYTDTIKYFDTWVETEFVEVPEYYILPQCYRDVIELLTINRVNYSKLSSDSLITVTVDYIDQATSPSSPYNGHYYHDKVLTHSEKQNIQYYKGDLIIPVRQKNIRYILEMLEPKAGDSFFRWNFFDNILDQREYFSSYGFEENALKYLEEHPEFRRKFEETRKNNPEMAKNHRAQLSWIYNNSEWLEKSWKRYPVGKIFN